MTLAYTLATEAPQVPVVVSVPNADIAAHIINETIRWSKTTGILVVDGTFVITI